MKKKYYFFITLSIMMHLFISCTKEKKMESTPKRVEKLRLNTESDLISLHPHRGIDIYCRIYEHALFEGLLSLDENDQPQLALAKEYEISNGGKRYTFTLRPTQWSNGEALTAHHFKQAWQWALTPDSGCLRADLLYVIKNAKKVRMKELPIDAIGIEAVDDHTLVVDLEHPAPYFLELITNTIFFPLYELDRDKEPTLFNGPYTLISYEYGKSMLLKKNALYWNAKNIALEHIESFFVKDPHTAMMMYEKGEIDFIGAPLSLLPLDSLEHAKKLQGFVSQAVSGIYWYGCNKNRPPMNSVKVRRALSIVLNRKELCEKAIIGGGPAKSILPTSISLLKEEELYKDNDLSMAKILFDEGLAELNIKKSELSPIEIAYSTAPAEQKMLAELLQSIWEKSFEIKVNLIASDWPHFSSNLMGKQCQIGGCRWCSAYNDPTHNLEFFKEPKNRFNTADWENSHYKELLDLADQEADPLMRNAHLKEAEKLLLEEMPVIPIYITHYQYIISDKVKGMRLSPVGFPDFKKIYLESEATSIHR